MSNTLFKTALAIYSGSGGKHKSIYDFERSLGEANHILEYCKEKDIQVLDDDESNISIEWNTFKCKPDLNSVIIMSEKELDFPLKDTDDFMVCRYVGGNVLERYEYDEFNERIHLDKQYSHFLWRYV